MNEQTLDFTKQSLSSRTRARQHLASALEVLRDADNVVIKLGDNLAMTSWVDEFLVPLIEEYGDRIVVAAYSEVTVDHIVRVLAARRKHVKVAGSPREFDRREFRIMPAA